MAVDGEHGFDLRDVWNLGVHVIIVPPTGSAMTSPGLSPSTVTVMITDKLPPAGPAWAGSVMGVSVAAVLSGVHGLWLLSWMFLLGATVLAAALIAGWVKLRNPGFGRAFMAPWAMVSMGLVSLGAAWTSVTGVWAFQTVAWFLAVPLALTVCARQLQHFFGPPTFLWGLPTVAPMVAAASGLQLARAEVLSQELSIIVWELSGAMAILSGLTAPIVFLVVYVALTRKRTSVPDAFAGTTWIPLGILGQSTVVALLLGAGTTYGYIAFALAVPMFLFAAVIFTRACLRGAGYTPAWWGSTFPVGVLGLGAHQMSVATASVWFDVLSLALLGLLLVHLAVCLSRGVAASRPSVTVPQPEPAAVR